MRPTKHFYTGVSLFLAMALCGPVVAEIEEITVTAQKREENVQDVPISVTTFSDDFFTKSNVNTLRDMARYAPNLSLPQSSTVANQRIMLRGVGSVGNSAIEPTVAVFIDGVYYPRPSSIVGSMTDLDRVEVLRGPQGTLFGRNASMGALNIVTKNPTNEHEGRIAFGYGDYDEKRVSGYINSAISETASARLSFQASERDGYGDNTFTDGGSRSIVGDWDDITVRGKLLLTPGINTDILLTADYSRVRNEGAVTEFIGDTAPGHSLLGLPAILPTGQAPEAGDVYDHKLHQMHRDDADDDQWGVSGDVTWTWGGHTIRSITAYRDWENDSVDQSVIRLPADLVPTDQLFDAETFSQELQITSPEGEDIEYVFGLYYYDEEYSLDTVSRLGKDFCGMVETLFEGNLLADAHNVPSPVGPITVKHAGARSALFAQQYRGAVQQVVSPQISTLIASLPEDRQKEITDAVVTFVMTAGTEIAGNAQMRPDGLDEAGARTKLNATIDDRIPNPQLAGGLKQALLGVSLPTISQTRGTLFQTSQNPFVVPGTQQPNTVTVPNPLVPGTTIDLPIEMVLRQTAAGAATQAGRFCVTQGSDMATTNFKQDVANYAAYGHVTYHLSPQWRLSAGARYTRSEKDGDFVSVVHNDLIAPSSALNPLGLDLRQNEPQRSLTQDEEKVTWLANLSHFLDEDTMVFANFSTGFKSGGFNPEGFNSKVAASGKDRKFDTETTKNYELGIKRTLLEGRLVANATLYRTKIDDFQERQFDGLNLVVHNSGDLTQQGVELDVMFQPREDFFATLGVSYLDSEFDSFPNATERPGIVARYSQARDAVAGCENQVAGGSELQSTCDALGARLGLMRDSSGNYIIPTQNIKGERNHFSPKWQISLTGEYTCPLPDAAADWFIRGEYQFVDDQNVGADTNQDPDTMQGNYNLFNGGMGVRSQNGDWEMSLFVKNIFDEEYCQTKYAQPLVSSLGLADTAGTEGFRGAKRCSLGEPRTWSLVGSFLF